MVGYLPGRKAFVSGGKPIEDRLELCVGRKANRFSNFEKSLSRPRVVAHAFNPSTETEARGSL